MLFDSFPVFYRVLFSLFVILFLSRFFKTVFFPLCIGTLILAFSLGHSLKNISFIFFSATFNQNTLFLFLVFLGVEIFSVQMVASGVMKRIVYLLKSHLDRKKSMAILPALIGFLPMPGGALFSAPLVDDCDETKDNDPLLKAKINYWFRHLWEYWWPMFPGVLLAIELSKLDALQFILLQLPMTFFSTIVGYFFLLRKVRGENEPTSFVTAFDKKTLREIIILSMPVFLVIIIYSVLKIFFPKICEPNKYLPMAFGILGGIALLQHISPLGFKAWKQILSSKSVYIMILLVYIVILYGSLIEGNMPDGSPVVAKICTEISKTGIPPIALLVIIPFLCGLSTGVTIAFVGASFPIIMSTVGENPEIGTLLCTTFIAYGCGYAGILLSPVHVCLIVTNEHFKTELLESIKKLAVPVFVLMALNITGYFVLKFCLYRQICGFD